jgi:hypothetical protein
MTDCPGYLAVTVNDRTDLEKLMHYDALISCPRDFNLTLHLPNTAASTTRTFDVLLDDAKTEHWFFLTSIGRRNLDLEVTSGVKMAGQVEESLIDEGKLFK